MSEGMATADPSDLSGCQARAEEVAAEQIIPAQAESQEAPSSKPVAAADATSKSIRSYHPFEDAGWSEGEPAPYLHLAQALVVTHLLRSVIVCINPIDVRYLSSLYRALSEHIADIVAPTCLTSCLLVIREHECIVNSSLSCISQCSPPGLASVCTAVGCAPVTSILPEHRLTLPVSDSSICSV
jgi:hypothetical protein